MRKIGKRDNWASGNTRTMKHNANVVSQFAVRPWYHSGRVAPFVPKHGSPTSNDGSVDIKIVDLQTLQCGSPANDLLFFIFTGSDEKFRAQYFDKLLDHYYTELSAAMKRLQLNPNEIFSREDFDFEIKEKLPYALSRAVFTLPIVTVEVEDAPQVDESFDISKFNLEKTSDLYAERLNGVVNDYVKWGILT